MNNTVQQIHLWLDSVNAPAWLHQPSAWLGIVCVLLAMLVVVRMMFKRRPQPVVASRRQQNGGAFGPLTEAFASQIPESDKERQEFGQMLRQAGFYSPTARASVYAFRFLFIAFPVIVAGILAVFSPSSQTFRILIAGGIVAAVLSITPRFYVFLRRQSRLREINAGLADMLDMLSMCLSGGMPLSASLDHVSKNLTDYPALAEELQIVKRQTEVGSLRTALADFANRIDTPEVRQVASLLTRGDYLGTSLSGSLLDQADHFRTTRKQVATLQSNRTPVLLTFPLLFCFAPAVLIVLMSPAFMQLSEFFDPTSGGNPLIANEQIGTGEILDTLGALDQRPPVDMQFRPGGSANAPRMQVGGGGSRTGSGGSAALP
jgi:tight adherence protein C